MPTPLETLGKINRDVETNTRAKEFANVARWLMVGKGNLGNAIHEAQAHRATERILTGLKAAVAAGSTERRKFCRASGVSRIGGRVSGIASKHRRVRRRAAVCQSTCR